MTTELMQFLLPYFEKLVLGLDIFAICLLIWGVCLSIKDFLKYLFVHTEAKNDRVSENNAIKKMLGGYILLSLEILVSAGIIESIIKPTLQDIFQLAALVVIRTIISYFLNKEIGPVDVPNKRGYEPAVYREVVKKWADSRNKKKFMKISAYFRRSCFWNIVYSE